MERDIRKLASWLEETLRVGIAEENKVLEWRLAERNLTKIRDSPSVEHAKAS